MDSRLLSSLIIRISGLVIVVSGVTSLPHSISRLVVFHASANGGIAYAFPLIASLLALTIGLCLIKFPAIITATLLPAEKLDVENGFDFNRILQTSFITVGLYVLCSSLVDGFYWLSKIYIYYAFFPEASSGLASHLPPAEFAGVAATILQFLIGITLVLGGKGLANTVQRLRG